MRYIFILYSTHSAVYNYATRFTNWLNIFAIKGDRSNDGSDSILVFIIIFASVRSKLSIGGAICNFSWKLSITNPDKLYILRHLTWCRAAIIVAFFKNVLVKKTFTSRSMNIFKRLQIKKIASVIVLVACLFITTACNSGNEVGARPEVSPVQLGGQNNPHKAGGDGMTQYRSPANDSMLEKN